MISFLKNRSLQPEMMDDISVPTDLLYKNLKELDILNRTTGTYRVIINQIKKIVRSRNYTYKIVDLGCGSGDLLKHLAIWGRKNNFKFELIGIDNNPKVISYLQNHCSDFKEISGISADVNETFAKTGKVDFVISSLFLHHLNDNEVNLLLKNLKTHVINTIIITDLKRKFLAYIAAWLLPRLLNGTVLSKTDGHLSILKAFKQRELLNLLIQANINSYKLKSIFPFRFVLTINNK